VAITSLNEGTPLTLIEAMANGRPVIATDVGGVTDLVGPPLATAADGEAGFAACERGLLVRPGDPEAFSRGLIRLAGDRALRDDLGGRGHAFVRELYPKERLIDDVAALYAESLRPVAGRTG
jgi:glycosyltransferase involved in cell wall biosynthesis